VSLKQRLCNATVEETASGGHQDFVVDLGLLLVVCRRRWEMKSKASTVDDSLSQEAECE
jgi:hypothetical protein